MSDLLVIGDSVLWGQGLIDAHKSASLLAGVLQAEMKMAAHSGANIGIRDSHERLVLSGEVPCSYPTIQEQIQSFAGDTARVRWVLINGGINDVDVRRILNPLHPQFDLDRNTRKYCGRDMLALLQQVMAKFPHARVLVVGYFPVLSCQSTPGGIETIFSAVHGVKFAPVFQPDLFRNALIDHCLRFWKISTESLQGAVDQANQAAGFEIAALRADLDEIVELPRLDVRGLMTIGRLVERPEDARPTFRALRELSERLRDGRPRLGAELSMGMSADFDIAVEEGATVVRVGQALFGERPHDHVGHHDATGVR
jgi:hypothetical protein